MDVLTNFGEISEDVSVVCILKLFNSYTTIQLQQYLRLSLDLGCKPCSYKLTCEVHGP